MALELRRRVRSFTVAFADVMAGQRYQHSSRSQWTGLVRRAEELESRARILRRHAEKDRCPWIIGGTGRCMGDRGHSDPDHWYISPEPEGMS